MLQTEILQMGGKNGAALHNPPALVAQMTMERWAALPLTRPNS